MQAVSFQIVTFIAMSNHAAIRRINLLGSTFAHGLAGQASVFRVRGLSGKPTEKTGGNVDSNEYQKGSHGIGPSAVGLCNPGTDGGKNCTSSIFVTQRQAKPWRLFRFITKADYSHRFISR